MLKNKYNYLAVLMLISLAVSACGPNYSYKRAQKLEKNGYYIDAGVLYEKVASKNPQYKDAPEALYRLGHIYQKKLKIYSLAKRFYKTLVERYPNAEPWAGLAKAGLLTSPDYFPLNKGTFWIEGDSATGGKNMRAQWTLEEVSTGTFNFSKKIYAGEHMVVDIKRVLKISGYDLQEALNKEFTSPNIMLSYPLDVNRTWKTTKDGRSVTCRIEADNAFTKVVAGEFINCLKVSEEAQGIPGKKYYYYAPDVGWVLTTVSGDSGDEHRNTELLSYKINP